MSNGHRCKPKPKQNNSTTTKCDDNHKIDCECLTHLSASSEHVICKWDPSERVIGQFAPGTASCIDGIKLSSIAVSIPERKVDPSNRFGTHTETKDQKRRVHNATGMRGVLSSTDEEDDLSRLKAELSETQALLEKTEEQLLHHIERSPDLQETNHPGKYLAGYHDSRYNNPTSSLQDVIGHLYLNEDDAKRLLATVKSRLQDMGHDITPDNYGLRLQLVDLQTVLEEITKGQGSTVDHTVTAELPKSRSSDVGRPNINVVETLMQKLNSKEDELNRWEVLVEQLNKELEQAKLRCESNTNALYSKQEECRQRETELHNACIKMQKLERLLANGRSKVSPEGKTRTTQTDMPPQTRHQQTPGGALSELTARLQQQQMTANELQLEREHNQRLQELRLGVVESGNKWEREVMTLDMQVKQLTRQLEDAKNQVTFVEEEKKHQKKHLQDMKESLKQLLQNREETSTELAQVKGQLDKSNQQLSAAQTALTYERSSNIKLKELNSAASKTELQLTEEMRGLQEIERRLSQQLTETQRRSSELRKQCKALCSDLEQANEELQERASTITRMENEMEVAMVTSKEEIESEREVARSVRVELEKTIQAGNEEMEALKEVMRQQDEDLKVLKETKKDLQRQHSDNAQLTETNNNLQSELKSLHTAIEEQREENAAIQKQSEAVKRDLEVALVRQKSYKEWGTLNERKMEDALKRWGDERTQLTNQATELQVTLKDTKNSLQQLNVTNQQYLAAKEGMQQRCEVLQQQVHVKDVSLQTTLERLSNTQRQVQEERRLKNESESNVMALRSTLEKKETCLQSKINRVGNLETKKANLKAMVHTQKSSIEVLQKQLQIQQREFLNFKTQTQTNFEANKETNENIVSDLQQQIKHEQDITHQSHQKKTCLAADLQLVSEALEEKRGEHCTLLQTLHTAEQKEKDYNETQQQLAHELQIEKETQESLRKRLKEQEVEVKELRQTLSQLQQEDSPDKSMHLEHLKESLDTSFRIELNQLKAEITRQATVKQTQTKKLSNHDKVVILQRELGKLRTLHFTDQTTIESLTDDVAMLRNRLAKQKALILNSSSQRIRKSDIQAALAKAQAKAFVTMSPLKRQQVMNFDPTGHLIYNFPQSTFDDFTLQGFGSERTHTSTAFSGGSSDCDYSS